MTLWVNEGNMVIDAHMKGQSEKAHRFISGTLASIDNAKSQMTLSTSGGEKNFKLKPLKPIANETEFLVRSL